MKLCAERLVRLPGRWTAAAPSDNPAYTWAPRQPHETSHWYPSHQHHLSLTLYPPEMWKPWLILFLSHFLKFHAMDTLHRHGYDLSSALSVLVPQGGPVLCRDEMEEWSSSEANLFEEALEKYGKDFNDIRQDFVSKIRKCLFTVHSLRQFLVALYFAVEGCVFQKHCKIKLIVELLSLMELWWI